MKTDELFKRRLNFDMAGVCQSIDDGAETVLTGDCRIQLTFKGRYEIFKNYL